VGLALRVRIREEEALLVEAFGDEYRAYQAQSWRLIPFIC
jgi:protein-S-isoprenylcysteine O-methyltransferase Ste14